MDITLERPLAGNSPAEPFDVRQVKKALNNLGYYMPYEKTGITGMPESQMFEALRAFQQDQKLEPTGEMKPGDETVRALVRETSVKQSGFYIWRTVGDDNVREAHAALDGTVRRWDDSPDPGEEFNCRCWAEPVEEGIRSVFPELALIPVFKIGRIVKIISQVFQNTRQKKFTNHGTLRSDQRSVSPSEIKKAMESAKETGNMVVKTGKYGTPQNHYRGTNGLTVVEETQGRNAGKIITMWWHK